MHRGYWQEVWHQFKKNKLALVSFYLSIILILIGFLAPILSNNAPIIMRLNGKYYFPAIKVYSEFVGANWQDLKQNFKEKDFALFPPVQFSPTEYDLDQILVPPNNTHLLGTDDQGRDILSRMIYGARVSLSVGFVAVGVSLVIGVIIGAVAGYYGGVADIIISRLIEIMICFPTFFLILAVIAMLEPSIFNIMIVIGLTSWTGIARLVRGEFLKCRTQDYVTATVASGATDLRIIFRHILPNSLAPVLVTAAFGIAGAVLIESSLSFLGFGVQPPTPSWGDILSTSRDYIDIAWWLTIFPGIAIFLTITAYNLIGEGLRDAVDPHLKA
jgi:peptide/nickel transport system permease protein